MKQVKHSIKRNDLIINIMQNEKPSDVSLENANKVMNRIFNKEYSESVK